MKHILIAVTFALVAASAASAQLTNNRRVQQMAPQIIAQEEQAHISRVAASPEVIRLRAQLKTATGAELQVIKEELQIRRDQAAADGRRAGIAKVEAIMAANKAANEPSLTEKLEQMQRDNFIFMEAMEARRKGQPYLVDPATAARIFGH